MLTWLSNVPQKATNNTATPNMPSSLPKNTDSSGTAAASTSITLLLRSSAIVPTAWPASSSVRKKMPNTPMKNAAWCLPPIEGLGAHDRALARAAERCRAAGMVGAQRLFGEFGAR